MAQAVFFVHGQFCHGFPQLWQKKDRVIAEAARSTFFGDDLALAESLCERNLSTILICRSEEVQHLKSLCLIFAETLRFTQGDRIGDGNGNRGMEARSPGRGLSCSCCTR